MEQNNSIKEFLEIVEQRLDEEFFEHKQCKISCEVAIRLI